MNKWITFSELCKKWGINQYDLAELVLNGKLQACFADDYSSLIISESGNFVESRKGEIGQLCKPLTVSDVAGCIFDISVVEKYEKNMA